MITLPADREKVERSFEPKIDKSAGETACWPWTAACGQRRQPRAFFGKKGHQARILQWILSNGDVPDGRTVTMVCGMPNCMNPGHMKLRARKDDTSRFWEKVFKTEGCWLWTGSREEHGYGVFHVGAHSTVIAHRYGWELVNGPIPKREGAEELCVCHHCDTPSCVRPDHLFLGTDKDNMRDMVSKGRAGWQKARANMKAACEKAMGVSDGNG